MKRWVTAVLLTGALALTACEADPAEPAEPTSSAPTSSEPTSAAPTTEPTGPVEPTLPPQAEQNTKAGAEAFLHFYWDVIYYAQSSGDTALLKNLAGPDCDGCGGAAEFVERVYAKDGHIQLEPYDLRSIRIQRFDVDSGAEIYSGTLTSLSSRQTITVPGEKTQHVAPVTERFGVTVTFSGGAWRLDVLGGV